MLCSCEAGQSLLKGCRHVVHGSCLKNFLINQKEMDPRCQICFKELRGPDISYVLNKYPNEFTEERYKALKWRKWRIIFQDLNEDDLNGSNLSG